MLYAPSLPPPPPGAPTPPDTPPGSAKKRSRSNSPDESNGIGSVADKKDGDNVSNGEDCDELEIAQQLAMALDQFLIQEGGDSGNNNDGYESFNAFNDVGGMYDFGYNNGNDGKKLLRFNFFMLQADVLPNMGFSATRKRLIHSHD